MANLIDLISDDDRAKVARWKQERFSPKHETEVPPEIYTIAEMGYYFGWGAIEACLRGYYDTVDASGRKVRAPLTAELMVALCKGAKKVWYRKILEDGEISMSAHIASRAKMPGRLYDVNTKRFRELAK